MILNFALFSYQYFSKLFWNRGILSKSELLFTQFFCLYRTKAVLSYLRLWGSWTTVEPESHQKLQQLKPRPLSDFLCSFMYTSPSLSLSLYFCLIFPLNWPPCSAHLKLLLPRSVSLHMTWPQWPPLSFPTSQLLNLSYYCQGGHSVFQSKFPWGGIW